MIIKSEIIYFPLLIFIYLIVPRNGYPENYDDMILEKAKSKLDTATFGAGCFWCTETIFERLKGVEKVISGYSGGHVNNPSYREVCNGNTGHAEVCRIIFNPDIISYLDLLDVFWQIHDPTTLNRHGNDVGPQYMSVIFYHSRDQKMMAENSREKIISSGLFTDPVITEISPLINFYQAEDYHQEYFLNNPGQTYCTLVIAPKVKKFTAKYQDKLK